MARQRGLLWPLIPPIEITIATNTQTRFNNRFDQLKLAKKVCHGTKARDWISTTQQPDKALFDGSQSPRSWRSIKQEKKPSTKTLRVRTILMCRSFQTTPSSRLQPTSLSRLRATRPPEQVNQESHTSTSTSNIDISINTAEQTRPEWQCLCSPLTSFCYDHVAKPLEQLCHRNLAIRSLRSR